MKPDADGDGSVEGERRSPSSEEERDEESRAEITNPDDYKEIFQPHKAICEAATRACILLSRRTSVSFWRRGLLCISQ